MRAIVWTINTVSLANLTLLEEATGSDDGEADPPSGLRASLFIIHLQLSGSNDSSLADSVQ